MTAVNTGAMSSLPAAGRWAIGKIPREELEALLAMANDHGMRTAWLGPDAGFLSNLSLYENLELFADWQHRPGRFDLELDKTITLLGLDASAWLHARPSHQPPSVLQDARLLRLVLLAPDIAIIEPADADRLLELPAEAFASILAHSRLLLRGPAGPGWPALSDAAMLSGTTAETPAP